MLTLHLRIIGYMRKLYGQMKQEPSHEGGVEGALVHRSLYVDYTYPYVRH